MQQNEMCIVTSALDRNVGWVGLDEGNKERGEEIIDDTLAERNRMAPQVCAGCITSVSASNYTHLPHGGAVLSGNYPQETVVE